MIFRLLMVTTLSILALACHATVTRFPALAGNQESTLDIYTSTDLWVMQPLLDDFRKLNPTVPIRYHLLTTQELDERFRAHAAANDVQADILISSAMDLQTRLVNDGYALPYYPTNARWLPAWAHWRHRAFGFTLEPAVIVYDPRQLKPDEVPHTRADLIRLLRQQPKRFSGKIGTYDINTSGVGYLLASQDALQSGTYGRMIESFGRTKVQFACCTLDLFKAIEQGDLLIGYNLLGSYARAQIKAGSPMRMVLPEDYTLMLSRTALIPRQAPDADLGKLFLGYLLSLRGQTVIAKKSSLFALHPALHGPGSVNALKQKTHGPLRPIGLGPGLLVYLDQMKHQRFLDNWNASVHPLPTTDTKDTATSMQHTVQ